MKVYRTASGTIVEKAQNYVELPGFDWDGWFQSENPSQWLHEKLEATGITSPSIKAEEVLAPLSQQEVWAAGVTYQRSRTARMEESRAAGSDSYYDRVYEADRPELFFKSTPHRVAHPGAPLRLRSDSIWQVPEPELTLAVNSSGRIFGYTIGNDLSSRDIEGENPLYLPQAKVWLHSAAIGPCIYLPAKPLSPDTSIEVTIERNGASIFHGETRISAMKQRFENLVAYLFRDNAFPNGCLLMTGTGVVPPDDVTLRSGDCVTIQIAPIGTLTNIIA